MKRWIANLRMWQKFALVGALAAGMVAGPTAMTVKGHLEDMEAARHEAAGMGPAGDVIRLLQRTQQHRGLSAAALAGNDKARDSRKGKQGEVDEVLRAAQASIAAFRNTGLDAQLADIQREWQELSSAVAGGSLPAPDSFKRHTALIARELGLLEGITDVSTLALDREAGSSYLIDAVLGELPKLTETLGQTRARGAAVLAKGEATADERATLVALVESTRSLARSTRARMDRSLEADPVLREALEATLASASAAVDEGLKLTDEQVLRADKPTMASSDFFAAMTRVIDTQFELSAQAFRSLDGVLAERSARAQHELWLLTASIAVLGGAATWIVVMVTRTSMQSVTQALNAARALAAGDLTHPMRADSRDEMGELVHALGESMEKLAQVVGVIKTTTESVSTAAVQISQGNHDLSQRTEEQSSQLQNTASSMEEITATVRQNCDTAQQATTLASTASQVAVQGGEVVSRVVSNMQDISASSQRIGDIIGVIDGIAFQTNILALNAAVEAARAGEHGRGFAVVASEVRSLAQRSAEAAKEIKALIGQSVEKVEAGSRLVGDAGRTMSDIVTQVKRVSELIEEISAASGQQSAGINQISGAVSQLDAVTQQNAALVEESAAAAESLSQQAAHLAQTVAMFKTEA
ncbi:methyl-accepting chemotaxis protein [Piscinibacter terrae]|uniref:Methyl-accepting chemotaxis protein n=1 Tax=Piscinibacter terrae TaxID=2496871 RepID=A0A3N7HWI0_9BURK|nr:methyl-accepting chemotaxis protein [Albitalea terrae]RQP26223.1 methyl-accepting chemotaxis protein [Albitalea terrae]